MGTLTFNATDGSSGLYLSDVAGLDGAATRHTEYPLPQRDGSVVLDVLTGAAYPTLTGEIRVTGTDGLPTRQFYMDAIVSYLDSIRKADGTLTWTPTNQADTRQLTVRLAEQVQIGNPGGVLKTFQIQLVAADPYSVSTVPQTANISSLSSQAVGSLVFPMVENSGGAFPFNFGDSVAQSNVVTPGGTAVAWPVVTITGPVTAPAVTNLTTGYKVSFPNLTLGSGVQLAIDMWNETATIGSASYIGYLDFVNSNFWGLLPNTGNSIQVSGANPADSGTATVVFSNTYV